MANLTENDVKQLLAGFTDPWSESDPVSLGWVRGIGIDGDRVSVDLRAGYPLDGVRESLASGIARALEADARIA
ncbi:MAG: DUF59 domain-containing protein, partial [Xanthomonadales bacterium]|nr:DUF59 domain-containing protein [Xanthomonadales bacterium]